MKCLCALPLCFKTSMAEVSSSVLDTSTVSDTPCSSRNIRKRRHESSASTYVAGKSRPAYKVCGNINAAQKHLESPTNMPQQVCHTCINPLSRVQQTFFGLKRQRTEIKRRQPPKNVDKPHYRNLVLQNEWLRANVQWANTCFARNA